MEFVNFKISNDNIGLVTEDGNYIDLHNNYDFFKLNYEFEKRYFEISWKKNLGDWVNKIDPYSLKLKFYGVEILRLKEIDQTSESLISFQEDDLSLSIIGLTTKDDTNFLSFIPENQLKNEEDYALIIQSENGQGIIIYSNRVELEQTND